MYQECSPCIIKKKWLTNHSSILSSNEYLSTHNVCYWFYSILWYFLLYEISIKFSVRFKTPNMAKQVNQVHILSQSSKPTEPKWFGRRKIFIFIISSSAKATTRLFGIFKDLLSVKCLHSIKSGYFPSVYFDYYGAEYTTTTSSSSFNHRHSRLPADFPWEGENYNSANTFFYTFQSVGIAKGDETRFNIKNKETSPD